MNYQVDLAKKDKTQREYFRSCKVRLKLLEKSVPFIMIIMFIGKHGQNLMILKKESL